MFAGGFVNYYNSYWVVKTDANGEMVWDKYFSGGDNDMLRAADLTADGGFILGGHSSSGSSNDKTHEGYGGGDAWIIKLDSNGNKIWDKTYGGDKGEDITAIQQTTDGGYVVAGNSFSGATGMKTSFNEGRRDYWIFKLDSAGDLLWEKTFGGIEEDNLEYMQQTSDGGYILGGYSESGISGTKTEESMGFIDYWIVKLDNAGNIEWQNVIGGDDFDFLFVVKETPDGGYIMGGESLSSQSGDKTQNAIEDSEDYWVVKTDATGQIEWEKTIGGDGQDGLFAISLTRDGGYLLGGHSDSNISGDKTEANVGPTDLWVVKLDVCGEITWDKTIGTSLYDNMKTIIQTTDGGYLLGGFSGFFDNPPEDGHNNGKYDFFAVKLAGCTPTYGESDVMLCNEAFIAPCGKSFTTSGDYEYALTNAAGCDSMVTLHLTVVEDFEEGIVPTLNGLMATELDAEYEWFDCVTGMSIAGAVDQEFIPTVDGTYQATITKNGCSKTSTCMFWEVLDIGLFGSNIGIEGVYPNPTEGEVVVELEKVMENVSVRIYNTMGQIVRHQELGSTGKFDLVLPNENGLYIINVKSATGTNRSFKVFKQ